MMYGVWPLEAATSSAAWMRPSLTFPGLPVSPQTEERRCRSLGPSAHGRGRSVRPISRWHEGPQREGRPALQL
eukprot:5736051-Alexandrium_andersonii.AAC.1